MSTRPVTTWQEQLRPLLDRYGKFGTRDDAYRALTQMANVAEQYIAEHPATDSQMPVKELLRAVILVVGNYVGSPSGRRPTRGTARLVADPLSRRKARSRRFLCFREPAETDGGDPMNGVGFIDESCWHCCRRSVASC